MADRRVTIIIQALDKASGQFQKVAKNLGDVEKQMRKTSVEAGKLGRQMVIAGTAMAGVGAVAIKMAADVRAGVTEVGTLMDGVTQGELQDMQRELQDLAVASGQALKPLIKARYDIVSAGFRSAADSATVLNQAVQLATAGASNAATSADILTTALNAYGMSADEVGRVSDVLFQTVKFGKTTLDQLAGSLGVVFPMARTSGTSIEEVGAAMSTMTAAGIETTLASTSLMRVLQAMAAPTGEAGQALEKMGIKTTDAAGKMHNLIGIVEQFRGLSLEEVRELVPDIRAARGLLAMANNIDTLRESFEAMGDAAGSTETAFNMMQATLRTQLNRALQSVKVALVEVGTALEPIARQFADAFVPAMQNLAEFVQANQGLVKTLAALVAGLIGAGGVLMGFNLATKAVGGLRIAFALLTAHPILAAITAIVGALVALETKFGLVTRIVKAFDDALKGINAEARAHIDLTQQAADVMAEYNRKVEELRDTQPEVYNELGRLADELIKKGTNVSLAQVMAYNQMAAEGKILTQSELKRLDEERMAQERAVEERIRAEARFTDEVSALRLDLQRETWALRGEDMAQLEDEMRERRRMVADRFDSEIALAEEGSERRTALERQKTDTLAQLDEIYALKQEEIAKRTEAADRKRHEEKLARERATLDQINEAWLQYAANDEQRQAAEIAAVDARAEAWLEYIDVQVRAGEIAAEEAEKLRTMVAQTMAGVRSDVQATADGMSDGFERAAGQITNNFTNIIFGSIGEGFRQATNEADRFFSGVMQMISQLAARLAVFQAIKLLFPQVSAGLDVGKFVFGMQHGGVAGVDRRPPGSRDVIPAMLSPGEVVLTPAQASALGRDMGRGGLRRLELDVTARTIFGTHGERDAVGREIVEVVRPLLEE